MASKEFIRKLKESINLVDVVAETVQLKRAGKYLTGLSPFAKEKTPSFFVDQDAQSFFCYSSNQGGDVITFVELTKGMNFAEAISYLANRAGMALEESHKSPEQIAKERQIELEKKTLYKLNQFAASFYQEQFNGPAGAMARDYAAKRGMQKDFILDFAVGYAPESWTSLRDYFLKIKAPLLKAYELGLFRTKGGEKPKEDGSNLFDTFRNRLIFPIRGVGGDVLGFGGRWLGPSTADAPKYLNSPESLVYEKDKTLYNLDQARRSIREIDTVVLVEGYMDCFSLVQAGFPNVVANCGTALTKNQTTILRKLASKVICLYDSDQAGQAATERAMNLFLDGEGVPLLGAKLPDGKDPDDFLKAHGENGRIKMVEILQNSPALLDEWIEKILVESPKNLQAKTDALHKISSKLAKLRDELAIQTRIPGVAKGLDMEPALVVEAIRKHKKSFMEASARQIGTNFSANSAPTPQAKIGPNTPPNKNKFDREKSQKSKQFQARSDTKGFGFGQRFLGDLLRNPDWITALREQHARDANYILPFLGNPHLLESMTTLLQPLELGEKEEQRIETLQEQGRENPALRNFLAESALKPTGIIPASDLEGAIARLKKEWKTHMADVYQRQAAEAYKRGDSEAGDKILAQLSEHQKQNF